MKFVHPTKGALNENEHFFFWASTDGDRIYLSGIWGDGIASESLLIHTESPTAATSFLKAEIQSRKSLRQSEDALEASQTMLDLLV